MRGSELYCKEVFYGLGKTCRILLDGVDMSTVVGFTVTV